MAMLNCISAQPDDKNPNLLSFLFCFLSNQREEQRFENKRKRENVQYQRECLNAKAKRRSDGDSNKQQQTAEEHKKRNQHGDETRFRDQL